MVFCSVNPVVVFGPVENDDLSTSVQVLKRLVDGGMPLIPHFGIGVVDVRDVARIHRFALEAPDDRVRGERFAASNGFMWVEEMAKILRERIPDRARKVPTRRMPGFVMTMLAAFMPEMRQVKRNVGRVREVSGQHACEVFGFDYIPAADSIVDTVTSLFDKRIVEV